MIEHECSRRDFLGQASFITALTAAACSAAHSNEQTGTKAMPTTARIRAFLRRPTGDIYYEVTGSGPALIFAHGLGGNHLSWWQQVPYFAARYTCVTFAHRGFAPSQGVPEPAAYADDLAALIEHLKLADVRLVAQSMGGWTCLSYALREPARVRALVMASTTGVLDFRQLKHPEIERLPEWEARAQKEVAELTKQGIHQAAGARMAREQPAMHFLYRAIDDLCLGLDKQAVRAKLVATRNQPPAVLAKLRMPVLFITGAEDIVIPPGAADAMAAAMPNAKVERVAEAGHSVYFERPQIFNQLLEAFLSETAKRTKEG